MMLSIVIVSCLALTIVGLPVETNNQKLLQDVNPELYGGGFEGDILLPPQTVSTRGVAINGQIFRWPNKVIPYDISAISSQNDRQTITKAMNQLMYDVGTPVPGQEGRQICVYFRPAQATDKEVLKIQYGNGCSASIGYSTNHLKTLNLSPNGCFHNGIIQHELNHVLGFFHEQSRPDRDDYITIHHENIIPTEAHNFEKYQWGDWVENQGFNYDYGSLMHYQNDAFTMNGRPTISTRQSNVVIGQREKLSPTDIAEIRHYYQC